MFNPVILPDLSIVHIVYVHYRYKETITCIKFPFTRGAVKYCESSFIHGLKTDLWFVNSFICGLTLSTVQINIEYVFRWNFSIVV